MLLIFIQAKGLELFLLFTGVTLALMLPATLMGLFPSPMYMHIFNSVPGQTCFSCHV